MNDQEKRPLEDLSKKDAVIATIATAAARERSKLEARTWGLRVSIGLNVGLISGLVVHFLANCR